MLLYIKLDNIYIYGPGFKPVAEKCGGPKD